MKLRPLFACLLLAGILISQTSQAQISIGAKGGLNVSNLSGLDANNFSSSALIGYHIGGYVGINLGRNFALQPEILYSTQGATIEGAVDENYTLNYLNVPVMVRFFTKGGLFLEAGPQFGFNVGEVDLTGNYTEQIENADFSVCGGLGYLGKSQGFGVGLRYNAGLTESSISGINSNTSVDFKNGVLQLSLYMRIFGGGKLKK
jgi:hypothetical protein